MAATRFRPGVRLIRPPGIRPPNISPVTGEPLTPARTYDPSIQADVQQFAKAYDAGYDVTDTAQQAQQVAVAGAAGAGGAAGAAGAAGAPANAINPTQFHRTAKVIYTLTTASVLALAAPPELRTFLLIRADVNNTVNIYVDFDYAAGAQCAIILTPGGYAFYDQFVPQGDIYLAASGTQLTGVPLAVITFANATATGQ